MITPLSTILNRMNRWQVISTIDETYKVYDIDEAIRMLRRSTQLPWTLQKSSLRVFDNVLEYPVAADHDELAYLDKTTQQVGTTNYADKARFRFTSLQQFYENPDYRNDLAEIWDGNTRYLGVRYLPQNAVSQVIDNAESTANYTASQDASAITLDLVNYKEGNGSIRFTNTSSITSATVSKTFTAFGDSNYKRKYFFMWVYLAAVPTSITLKFGSTSSNYFSATVLTQFSGQPFKAGQWNFVSMDLNTATETGAVDSTAFAYFAITLTGAATGSYYIDTTYIKEWALMDYWYYSKYNVALVGSTVGNQEYFKDTGEVYALDSSLVGDSEWVDVIMYDAILTGMDDKENDKLVPVIREKLKEAFGALLLNYPSMRPLIISLRYRFLQDLTQVVL